MPIRCGHCKGQHDSVAAVRWCFTLYGVPAAIAAESPTTPRASDAHWIRRSDEQRAVLYDLQLVGLAADRPVPEPPRVPAHRALTERSRIPARRLIADADHDYFSMTWETLEDLEMERRGGLNDSPRLHVSEAEWDYEDREWLCDAGMPLEDDYSDESWP
jgi:hypothetical protein